MRTRQWIAVLLFVIFVYHPSDLFAQEQEINIVLTPVTPQTSDQQKIEEEANQKLQQILTRIANMNDPVLVSGLYDLFKVYSEIHVHYVDPKSSKELLDLAMKGMVGLLDPYSNLYIDEEAQLVLEDFSEQNYKGGIGISIGIFNREVYVFEAFEDHPAGKAGIEPGDVILSIDGKSIFGMTTTEIVTLMKGPDGTSVSVEIRSRNSQKPRTFQLIRQEINVSSVVYKDLDRRNAYIRIRSFTPETVARFSDALRRAGNKRGLVIDLRDNGGGSLDAVRTMIGNFIGPNKVVVASKGRDFNGDSQEFIYLTPLQAWTSVRYPSKIVVLVNNFSASASEIMAGNLQHYEIAAIMGVRTFGKATVQNYLDLDKPDHEPDENTRLLMGITIARYYLPDGTDISSVGVMPDIEVEQPDNFRSYEYGTIRDRQLQEALKFLRKK